MRWLIWFLRALVFLLLLAFLSRNSGTVSVRFFLDTVWSLPLSLVMLVFFAGGVLLGVAATASTLLRQRREMTRLRDLHASLDAGNDLPVRTTSRTT